MSENQKKPVWKRWWFWICIIILIGVIANLASEDSGREQPTISGTQKTTKTDKSAARIGNDVSAGNFTYRVNQIDFKKTVGNQFSSQTADGIFLIVDITILNTSKETRTLDNSMFKLINSSGVEYESSIEGSTALEMGGSKTLFLKQCQPGIKTSGFLIFEVPNKTDKYTLKVSGGFWSGQTADISLN